MLKELKWDSDFFGYKIGSYRGNLRGGGEIDRFEKEFGDNRFDCVYIFCEADLLRWLTGEAYKHILPMSGHVEYVLSDPGTTTNKARRIPSCKCTTVGESGDADVIREIRSLSEELALVSRFYADPAFRSKAGEMYGIWMDKILKNSDGLVVVGSVHGEVAGVIASEVKDETGVIELVKAKKEFTGMGVGSSMLGYTVDSLLERGAKQISVKTQIDNLPARHLYEKSGFVPGSTTRIYHWWRAVSV